MKKLLSVLLCLTLVLSMAVGCGNSGTQDSTGEAENKESPATEEEQGGSDAEEGTEAQTYGCQVNRTMHGNGASI